MADDLTQLIESNPDPRELKRALAVQMFLLGLKHREIQEILSISSGFISKWTQLYELSGVASLKLGHRGSSGYLTADQRASIINWIKSLQYWHLPELQAHLEVEVPMTNERERQTYYGAVNLATGQCLVQPYNCGNGEMTVEYLTYLSSQFPNSQIALIWDGASYHRSAVVKTLLESVNQGLAAEDWKITCLQFAPNDPTQNPIEDIWLQAKRWLRECYYLCKNFAAVKVLFELSTHCQIFDFAKLNRLGEFSLII